MTRRVRSESRAKGLRPIPPRSVVELVAADRRTPLWRGQIGRRFRVGYYSPQDGLDTIWLVDDGGSYCQTINHAGLEKYFRVIRRSREADLFGRKRRPLGPRRVTATRGVRARVQIRRRRKTKR
jgi:hypothetical protein